jgi:hypothetical protein
VFASTEVELWRCTTHGFAQAIALGRGKEEKKKRENPKQGA